MITVLLVDDQERVREGLRMLLTLEPDVTVVGEAPDGAAALSLASALHPEVVVMDVMMPGMDGIAATIALRRRVPESHVVILSLYDDPTSRSRAQRAGAAGFVGKHQASDLLIRAIRHTAVSQS